MAPPTRVPVAAWDSLIQEVESAFHRPVPDQFRAGRVDCNQLLRAMVPAEEDAFFRGKILLGHELRLIIADQLQRSPHTIKDTDAIAVLLPGPIRRRVWAALTQSSQFQWPRLGIPPSGQTAYGIFLLTAFVLCFIYPLLGLALFFGGIILSYRVEDWARSFGYKTVQEVVDAAVRRSWPALELGAADDEQMEAVLTEVFTRHLPDIEIGNALPVVEVDDPWSRLHSQFHILNGDALREQLVAVGFRGPAMVMRECLVVGPLGQGADFWNRRKAFIHSAYDAEPAKYDRWVGEEVAKLDSLTPDTEINLWFDNDLFCQANLWFLVADLERRGFTGLIYRIFPKMQDTTDLWAEFSSMDQHDFLAAFGSRVALNPMDLDLGKRLWSAFSTDDPTALQHLAQSQSPAFPALSQVIAAHLDRRPDANGWGRPERTLLAIRAAGDTALEDILREFKRREPVYGFGDLQIKELLSRLDSPGSPQSH